MELEKLALCTREEFEQELNKLCPDPTDDMNPGEYDAAIEERVRIRRSVKRLRVEALLDGKLTVNQVVDRQHVNGDEPYEDELHRKCLKEALEDLKKGRDREDIIIETENFLELI